MSRTLASKLASPDVQAMLIRFASRQDVSTVEQIAQRAYGHYVERMGQVPAPMCDSFDELTSRRALFVIEDQATRAIVGYCALNQFQDAIGLRNVAVDPRVQGAGLGGRLIAFCEGRAIVLGFDRIELYTNIHMTENQTLYPALGYDEFDRREEDGFSRIYYRKRLR